MGDILPGNFIERSGIENIKWDDMISNRIPFIPEIMIKWTMASSRFQNPKLPPQTLAS